MTDTSKSSQAFLAQMMVAPVALGFPSDGIMKKYERPIGPVPGALSAMMLPQNCPVPAAPQISDVECARLAAPADPFFQNVLRPTIKHV